MKLNQFSRLLSISQKKKRDQKKIGNAGNGNLQTGNESSESGNNVGSSNWAIEIEMMVSRSAPIKISLNFQDTEVLPQSVMMFLLLLGFMDYLKNSFQSPYIEIPTETDRQTEREEGEKLSIS